MNISKEFLLEAVGLSLLVALILVGMQMFQRTIKITALIEKSQEQTISDLEEYEIVKYEEMLIDGITAFGYIKNVVGEYHIPISIEDKQKKFSVTQREEFGELRDIDSEKYLNPYAWFRCKVVRDENGVITQVNLVREQEGE